MRTMCFKHFFQSPDTIWLIVYQYCFHVIYYYKLIRLKRRTIFVPLSLLSVSFMSMISREQSMSYFSFMILIRFRRFSKPTELCNGLFIFFNFSDSRMPMPLSSMTQVMRFPFCVNLIRIFFSLSEGSNPCHIAFSTNGCIINDGIGVSEV